MSRVSILALNVDGRPELARWRPYQRRLPTLFAADSFDAVGLLFRLMRPDGREHALVIERFFIHRRQRLERY